MVCEFDLIPDIIKDWNELDVSIEHAECRLDWIGLDLERWTHFQLWEEVTSPINATIENLTI